LRDNLENRYYGGKQMAVMVTSTGAPPAKVDDWESIPWTKVKYQVKRLQMRIAKAMKRKQFGKVKALQRLLTTSYYAKCLAVKRVKQNKGGKCPGVDGIVWRTNRQVMMAVSSLKRRGYRTEPLRRIYIPKSSNPKALRPLSIPTIKDRAMQALHLLSLEPVAEVIADKNSYGFRPKRSTADAIEQCFNCLSKRNAAKWVLEGDIKSFFDTVNFKWLEENVPMDNMILKKFLEAGYLKDGSFEESQAGIPQGGIISPCISLITLSGIEKILAQKFKRNRGKVNIIFYADDFIVTGESEEILRNEVMPLIEKFLSERGLELSRDKTHITHIDKGFNFLGFNIRKYNEKCLIKPSKVAIKTFIRNIKTVIKANAGAKTENLIQQLNPKIRGGQLL
jgi:RNA-directed DNA polymerase